jgi:glycosyltransferase involved in cell wall biosynthesis
LIEGYGINPKKVIVNYNASKQPEEYKGDLFPIEKKPHQILATARLTIWKGVEGIIKAVNIVRKTIPDIQLIIAGDGPELENLKQLSKELDLQKNITFLGRISKQETESLRRESILYILNSTYEGLPHTVLTSFYAGIPVIATDIPGTNEAAIDNQTAVLVPPENPEALAEAIENLMKDPEKQKMLVENGRKLLREKFSWDSHIKNLLTISQSLISEPIN